MKIRNLLMVTAVTMALAAPAMAQTDTTASTDTTAATGTTDTGTPDTTKPRTAASETQRDVNQQNRIEQGLDSGSLNTREAAKLEHGESHIDHVEANAMKDGTLSAGEKAHIQAMQTRESKMIYGQKHDAQTGNPDSASSQRMQADVQRDANQEQRIHNGVTSGTLTNHETARLERGQSHNDRAQYRAGRNGRVGAAGQAHLQHRENIASRRTFGKKHNGRFRRGRAQPETAPAAN